jgi:hypothetical protein
MGVDVFRFKVKKKITKQILLQASTRSRNIKAEAKTLKIMNEDEIISTMKEEMSNWRYDRSTGYTYVDDSTMTLVSFYGYLENKGYITKPLPLMLHRNIFDGYNHL